MLELRAMRALEERLAARMDAVVSAEIGGANAIRPMAVTAHADIAVLDAGGMGRAFPELQMETRGTSALSQIMAGHERRGYPVTGTTFGPTDAARARARSPIRLRGRDTRRRARRVSRRCDLSAPRLVAAHVDPAAYRV